MVEEKLNMWLIYWKQNISPVFLQGEMLITKSSVHRYIIVISNVEQYLNIFEVHDDMMA